MYLLGPLLFGIATFRAGVLPRWAGALFVAGATLGPVGALLVAPEYQPLVMVPNGLALAWLGYALVTERRQQTSEAVLDPRTARPEPSQAA
jgi:membrane protein implicated in regulation of membrane protease activity